VLLILPPRPRAVVVLQRHQVLQHQ
jgi:hypothetical protein